ncbi:hypothetical protein ASPVEDRAFT_149709 [Aspergillus versicolor CBS 583.65]|uniref:Major facilitator superfamily (MFS) profile domain-containing protein n=1 Tax=Aspergillus versicolor CBS 583.65 TaxID=1036611 RepID=A0A1L9PH48_ASPVE|nr:uncharacterized protein ASPVEDRAFT_149709 [Aspergillus versicolor CBS 583.65]OJJ00793.1 hypothetical protein ASPVEDRAFT_149709 [Aspergillus versicolor CBS 583.65]
MLKSHLSSFRGLNPYLLFCIVVYLFGALLFGIDTGSFGSLQALPSFLLQFGTQNEAGEYELPTQRKSLMNSIPWIGKFVGCFLVEPLIERVGYRKSIIVTSVVQIVALIIEMTAKSWQQFTIGRNFAYLAVGLVENLVPAYCAEIAPSALRGLLAGSITFVVALGNLWGSGMSRAYVDETSARGWLIPCAMQLIPAVIILGLIGFTPESPRWLLLKGNKDLAMRNLEKLRNRDEVDNGYVAAEIDAISEAIAAGYSQGQTSNSWWKIFSDPTNYGRRAYGPTFYKQSGYGGASFTYATVGQAMTIVGSLFGILVTDYTGRRPLMIWGGLMCGVLLSIGAALGSHEPPNQAEKRTVIATFLLLGIFTKISASNNAFLIGAEIGGVKMRKKIMAFGTANDVLAAFLVTFVTPYLLANPGPNLGPKIGWIFAAAGYLSGFFGFFFTPELKGRSLEEVDQMFEAGLHAWQFKDFQTTGAGRRLTELERHDKTGLEGVEEVQQGKGQP